MSSNHQQPPPYQHYAAPQAGPSHPPGAYQGPPHGMVPPPRRSMPSRAGFAIVAVIAVIAVGVAGVMFRNGETTFQIDVRGWIEHPDSGVNEPLTEEITFREITDIVTALGGGQAGEPQISESAAQEYPRGLEDFGDPLPPTEGSGEERCAPVTTVATEQLDMRVKGTTVSEGSTGVVPSFHCVYEPSGASYGSRPTSLRNLRIDIEDLSRSDVMYPAGELGYDLRFTMDELRDSEGAGQLYALPAGTSGYMVYEDDGYGNGYLKAGYVVGDYYVSITISGDYWPDDYTSRALTEEELVDDLSTVLTAMNG